MDEPKPALTLARCLALGVLGAAAVLHLLDLVMARSAEPSPEVGYIIFIGCLWALGLWRVWSRASARGVGVVMMLLGAAFFELWRTGGGMCRGTGGERDWVDDLQYLPYEVVLLATGLVCLLLPSTSPEWERAHIEILSE
ncbi:MAG TPA: hypothetical protein VLE43_05350 [Candidatus Saccharimonadia bacterium]|nr:hypothetical protein [Candidatus Saccharimonadia bacterium]